MFSAGIGGAFIKLRFTDESSVAVYTVTCVRHNAVDTDPVDARRRNAFVNVNTAIVTHKTDVTVARVEVYVINALAIYAGV